MNAPLRARVNPVLPPSANLRDQLFGPIEDQFNRIFDDLFAVPRNVTASGYPRLNVYETDDKFVVEYAVAGVNPDDVTVRINEDPNTGFRDFGTRHLVVSGKSETLNESRKDARYHVKELTAKSFERTMILPDYVTTDPVATFKNGLLTLTFDLPEKEEKAVPHVKTIPIEYQGEK